MNARKKSGSFLTGRFSLDRLRRDVNDADRADVIERTVGSSTDNPTPFDQVPDRSRFGPLTAVSRRAMATDFEVEFNDPAPDGFSSVPATQIALAALDEIDRVESILSLFRPESTVGRINALASEMDIPVSEEFFDWLDRALEIGRTTNRAFDVAAGPLWSAWGFARREGRFPSESERLAALAACGPDHLTCDRAEFKVRFDSPDCALNFGGIGKGMGLDAACRVAEEAGLTDFLIQGGKSGVIARGGRRGDFSDALGRDLWTVNVADPLRPNAPLATIRLADRALSTSGSAEQFFILDGRRYSHILDPLTGFPARGILSATVLAETAAEADALSTAFFVMGVERTAAFCRANRRIAALLVVEDDSALGRRLTALNMTPDVLAVLSPEIPVDVV